MSLHPPFHESSPHKHAYTYISSTNPSSHLVSSIKQTPLMQNINHPSPNIQTHATILHHSAVLTAAQITSHWSAKFTQSSPNRQPQAPPQTQAAASVVSNQRMISIRRKEVFYAPPEPTLTTSRKTPSADLSVFHDQLHSYRTQRMNRLGTDADENEERSMSSMASASAETSQTSRTSSLVSAANRASDMGNSRTSNTHQHTQQPTQTHHQQTLKEQEETENTEMNTDPRDSGESSTESHTHHHRQEHEASAQRRTLASSLPVSLSVTPLISPRLMMES